MPACAGMDGAKAASSASGMSPQIQACLRRLGRHSGRELCERHEPRGSMPRPAQLRYRAGR